MLIFRLHLPVAIRLVMLGSIVLLLNIDVKAQEWWFWPKYTLGQKAENYPGNRIDEPISFKPLVSTETVPLVFHGEEPTERREDFVDIAKLSKGSFSIELWVVNHVNQPVGVLSAVKSKYGSESPSWLLGIYDRNILFSLSTEDNPFSNLLSYDIKSGGWKQYWYHIVATFDGSTMSLYVNGELVNSMKTAKRKDYNDYQLEVASYTHNEPYMDLGNLLKMMRLSDRALSKDEIKKRFEALKTMVVEGKLFPNTFHFNAGPYLNNATTSSIDIVWETDRPADFVIEYGQQVPMDKKITLNTQTINRENIVAKESNIYTVKLDNLDPETPYFYTIKAKARDGSVMESGILTFSTAVKENSSYAFAVIGDTEARPHINDRVCKMVWEERPNFLMLVGDLTDGGTEDHKFEWNYEYFQGVTQLASRVPVFPVAGNGEEDLYWYDQYHVLPEPEGYYSYKYGNAEFFMLNSNRPEEFAPGEKQYIWLEEQLKKSTAVWKFVAHHHAPYSADEDDYGNAWRGKGDLGDKAIRKIVPLYEKYNVNMVFFGHLHTYQRTLPIRNNIIDKQNGVIYVQGGGGGGNLEDFAPSRAWFSAKTYRGHHYFMVTVHGNELNFRMYDTEGRLKDYLDLKK
jgi:Icc-related predicted phosphoesterase